MPFFDMLNDGGAIARSCRCRIREGRVEPPAPGRAPGWKCTVLTETCTVTPHLLWGRILRANYVTTKVMLLAMISSEARLGGAGGRAPHIGREYDMVFAVNAMYRSTSAKRNRGTDNT